MTPLPGTAIRTDHRQAPSFVLIPAKTSQERPTASLNVPGVCHNLKSMADAGWAQATARALLEEPLPRRWAHTQGAAAAARTLAPILGEGAELIVAAAWLHDIGYAPAIAATGFHPLDGARYLRDREHADELLCRLVANHTCAFIEAGERGLADDLIREFPPPPADLLDALIYCDMTAGPDGEHMTVIQRLAEIRGRYGPADAVTRALGRSAPQLTAAANRIARKLASAND
jgi:HD domain